MKDQSITKNAKVTIDQDGRKFDWWVTTEKLGPSQLWLSTGSDGKSLSINVQYAVAGGRHTGHTGAISLGCPLEENIINKGSRGKRLYGLDTRASTVGIYNKVNVGGEMNIGISLKDCQGMAGGQIECSLNVVTNNP